MFVEIFFCLELCTDNSTFSYPFLTDDHSLAVYTSMLTFIEIIPVFVGWSLSMMMLLHGFELNYTL